MGIETLQNVVLKRYNVAVAIVFCSYYHFFIIYDTLITLVLTDISINSTMAGIFCVLPEHLTTISCA